MKLPHRDDGGLDRRDLRRSVLAEVGDDVLADDHGAADGRGDGDYQACAAVQVPLRPGPIVQLLQIEKKK